MTVQVANRIGPMVTAYAAVRERYEECARSTADLIERLVRDRIKVHRIEYRAKTAESLREKLLAKWDHYNELADVTDLAGVRVVCFFAEDVDKVARIIEREFIVDPENTVDKRSLIDADRFGYVSMHHIVRWKPARCEFGEYRHLTDLRIEIQTKSLLQHAWAEIEHGLGYKHVPLARNVRRRFSRVAGLLELADLEFEEIRKALAPAVAEIPLDASSLAAFIESEPAVEKTDKEIAARLDLKLEDNRNDIHALLERLHLAEIRTLDQLKRAFKSKRRKVAVTMAVEIFRGVALRDIDGSFGRGISLFYAAYVAAVEQFDGERLAEFRSKAGIELSVDQIRTAYEAALASA